MGNARVMGKKQESGHSLGVASRCDSLRKTRRK